ncbi:Hint domain-containing protein [Roseivivax sp. THAF40]|nr:Hint domain-containing protein [Roseivivax sp. THAF40]
MIFLGNFADVDTDETDADAESANTLLGTYDAFSDLQLVEVTNEDVDNDGAIRDDEFGTGDFVTYTRDGTNYVAKSDTTMDMWVRITDEQGNVSDIEVAGIQMDNGDFFITDLFNAGTLDNLTIRSVEVYSIPDTNFAGYTSTYNVSNTSVCYCSGTMIRTAEGDVAVEQLRPDMRLLTFDQGLAPLLWIGSQRYQRPGPSAPVTIGPGSLGPGRPDRALHVSPQHRLLASGPVVRRMFGTDHVLLPAKRLLPLPGIARADPSKPVRYWHLLCDGHEVIFANGMPAETLFLGPMAWQSLSGKKRAEIAKALVISGDAAHPPPQAKARFEPGGARQRRLIERLLKNRKPLSDLPALPQTTADQATPPLPGRTQLRCDATPTAPANRPLTAHEGAARVGPSPAPS